MALSSRMKEVNNNTTRQDSLNFGGKTKMSWLGVSGTLDFGVLRLDVTAEYEFLPLYSFAQLAKPVILPNVTYILQK